VRFLESRNFERFILAVVLVNALVLGLETWPVAMTEFGTFLIFIDRLCLLIFCIELGLKAIAYRSRFFSDAWRVFDLIVVGFALMPASGGLSVLRSLRILRALRMISVVPRLRRVVTGLLYSIPSLGAVFAILGLLFYVGAVISTKIFGQDFPEWFGSLGRSAYSLFQVMTLESWSMGIARVVMEKFPHAWIFFVIFILVTTFTMLNLFVAVMVNSMQAETEEHAMERDRVSHEERVEILEELRRLRRLIESRQSP
jgi:voltage-gated sodium channel